MTLYVSALIRVNSISRRNNILAMAMRIPKMMGQVPRSRCSLQHLNMIFPIAIMHEMNRMIMPMAYMTWEATCHPVIQNTSNK
jgi:hypothetical protein